MTEAISNSPLPTEAKFRDDLKTFERLVKEACAYPGYTPSQKQQEIKLHLWLYKFERDSLILGCFVTHPDISILLTAAQKRQHFDFLDIMDRSFVDEHDIAKLLKIGETIVKLHNDRVNCYF
jgi:hypothetical protein